LSQWSLALSALITKCLLGSSWERARFSGKGDRLWEI
jgi:hypothetical protein